MSAQKDFTIKGANGPDCMDLRQDNGQRVWTCDACGKRSTWRPGWRWFGKVCDGTSWYDNGVMEWCACSDVCAKKCEAKRSVAAAPAPAPAPTGGGEKTDGGQA